MDDDIWKVSSCITTALKIRAGQKSFPKAFADESLQQLQAQLDLAP